MEDEEYLSLIAQGRYKDARKALDGTALGKGAYVTQSGEFRFYHGSTAKERFTSFYRGRNIFLTTSRRVALSYAGRGNLGGEDVENFQFECDRLKGRWEGLKAEMRDAKDSEVLSKVADFLTEVIGFPSFYDERSGIFSSALGSDSSDDRMAALFRVPSASAFDEEGKSKALRALSPIDGFVSSLKQGNVYWLYAFAENPLVVDAEGHGYTDVPFDGDYESTDGIASKAWSRGYDCVEISEIADGMGVRVPDQATDLILKDPSQVKSANLITFDDAGNVIPLSKRFSDSDDIREDDGMSEWLMSYSQRPQ